MHSRVEPMQQDQPPTHDFSRRTTIPRMSLSAWRRFSIALWCAFLLAAALNLLHVRGGFLTNHLADVVTPALLYVSARRYPPHRAERPRVMQRWLGATPERAALAIFLASAATEIAQYFRPHGVFRGTFDPYDVVAYFVGTIVFYALDRRQLSAAQPVSQNLTVS